MTVQVRIFGAKEFERAIKKNPKVENREGKVLLQRASAIVDKLIKRTPWKVGDAKGSGKGAPVDEGTTRDTHGKKTTPWSISIFPTTPYAPYVHFGTKKMKGRPWLDVAKKDLEPSMPELEQKFLKKITTNLAK